MALELAPATLEEAQVFIERHHRHHGRVAGCKFCIAATSGGEVVGVVVVGRPVARFNDDGWTLEVTRVATNGARNACSLLYGAAWRAAKALGYRRMITYTLITEPGTSLHAAGWKCLGERGGGSWNCASRPRVDKHPLQPKLCWEAT